jgi:nicotinamidase-related amidase
VTSPSALPLPDLSDAVVLVMDVQRSIVERFPTAVAILPRVRAIMDAARAAGVPVGFVVVGFREGFPEISPRNATFSMARRSGTFSDPASREIHPDVAPRAGEWIVTKHRVGAFEGTDLDVLLRAAERHTLVLTGIATSGVVLSTARAAADKDFRLVVVEDACADADEEVHRVLTTKVLARQAAVVRHDAMVEALRALKRA